MLALYMYYTSFGDKMNLSSMRSSNFHRFLVDADIERTHNDKDRIAYDILYKKYLKNTNSMNF